MPTLLDKLLNRQEQNSITLSVTAEELQSMITMARDESARLNALMEQSRTEQREHADSRETLDTVQNRIFEVKTELKKLEERMDSAQSMVNILNNLDQKVRTVQGAAEDTEERVQAFSRVSEETQKKLSQIEQLQKVFQGHYIWCNKLLPLLSMLSGNCGQIIPTAFNGGRWSSLL